MHLYSQHLSAFHVVILSRKEHGYADSVHEDPLHLYPTNSDTRIGMLADAFRIARRLLKARGDTPLTITSQDPLELGFLAYVLSRIAQVPFTVQIHGDYYNREWAAGSVVNRFRRLLIPFVLGRAVSIRVVSERIKNSLLERGIPEEKIVVLPIRPELNIFLDAHTTRTKSTREEPFVVLTVSRLAPEKDIERLIAAFAQMHASCERALLRIVGSGSEEERLRECAKKHGVHEQVTFAPWTEHVEREMSNADLFALTSKHEAYGLVLIEALTTGLPVVTTDVGCVGEVVKDGVHGLVVHDQSAESFAEALIRMYEDDSFRARASDAGRTLGKKLTAIGSDEYAGQWVAVHTQK